MQIHDLCAEERTKVILQRAQSLLVFSFPPKKETSASLNPWLPAAAASCPFASDALGSLHVDGVRMLLAQGFVLLRVEWLPLQIHMADCADEAGVVPGMPQGFDKFVTSLHGEITAMTLGAEQVDIVFLTVGLPIFHVEEAIPEGLLAGCTDKAGGVPCLSQGVHHFPHDFGVALGTDWGEELLITPLTVNIVLLLHKAYICQGGLAVGTVELFWVPGAAHGYQKGAPDDAVAVATERSPAAGWEALGPLDSTPGKGGHLGTLQRWGIGRGPSGQALLADGGGAFARGKLLREAVICHPWGAAGRLRRAPTVGRGVIAWGW